jgi:ribonuclease HII
MPEYYKLEDKLICGCDEAGRGCLAGPVVAAAVILPPDYYHPILNDSKQVKESDREKLKVEIISNAIAYGIGIVSHQEIDEINILKASFLAMHRAVDQMKTIPEWLIIDGNRFAPYEGIGHHCIVKGDSKFTQIAAASILAKTFRDEYMNQLAEEYPQYHWSKNKGYPTKAHRSAIKEFGVTPHHRMTFRLLAERDNFILFE